MNKRSLAQLGEFGLIDHLTSDFESKNKSTIYGIGDDAAVLDYEGKKMVVTTDLLMEGIHFDLMYTPMKHLGYKAVAVNLSDVYSMMAIPKQITVSIALSKKFSVELLEELYSGIRLACQRYGVDLIGGDTSSSLTGLCLSITAIGELISEPVYRKGAKENDLVCVSGDLGAAFAGLQVLEREKLVFQTNPNNQPDLTKYEYVVERFLKPEPRRDVIDILNKTGIVPTSMIDISDGLSSEILHICRQSQAGVRLYEEKLCFHEQTLEVAAELNLDPALFALNGGEDYELLFTVPLAYAQKISNIPLVSIIGHITKENTGRFFVTKSGQETELQAQGWNALKK